ncbi:MAG: hypothetical protein JNM77_16635 [Pseudonocardia sp.]|nr:hypothetical protein [Pseudonocardia sp.]
MNLADLNRAGAELGTRFTLLGTLPLTVVVTVVAALVAAGAPGRAPDLNAVAAELGRLSVAEGVLTAAAVLIVAVLLTPLQNPLVRLFQGHWGTRGPIGWIAESRISRHREIRLEIDKRTRHVGASAPTDASSEVAKWELRHRYPSEEAVRPTVLGNVLRAAEGRAGAQYGLDSVVTWPRLYPLLDDKVAAVVDDQRTQLDVGVRFAACFLAAAVLTFGLLVAHGWWLVVPALFGVLSYLAYRGSVVAADGYGRAVEAAYDRHHLDLRDALGVSRPASSSAELALNEQLMLLWRGKTAIDIEYDDRQ